MSAGLGRRGNLARGLVLSVQILGAHRLRTLLSISGLLIGVAAVMVMAAIGQGADRQLLKRLQAMGTDLIVVSPAPALRIAGRPRQAAMNTDLSVEDADAFIALSNRAIASAPAVNSPAVLRRDGLNRPTGVTGTTASGLRIRNIKAGAGRLFDDEDDQERRTLMLLGPAVARSLFPGVDPVGQELRLGKLKFEVIGVSEPRGIDPLGNDLDDFAAIPFGTAMRRVLNIPYVHAVYVQANGRENLDGLERDVREILRARHPVRTGISEPFLIQNQTMLLRAERAATTALNRLIPAVSGIALLLGSVGILTVMLMSVRERTREIGLRRALGATRKDIRTQFILESALLGAAGGALGILAGLLASFAAAFLGGWDLIVSWPAAALGFASSMILGVLIGSVPASRAARLEPIEALRAS